MSALDVLVLAPWLPWPPHDGGRIRMLETLRFLARRHRVSLITPLYAVEEQDHVAVVRDLCEDIRAVPVPDGAPARLRRLVAGLGHGVPGVQAYHRNGRMARAARTLTEERRFDVVHVEFSFLSHYLRALSPRCAASRVLSMHNVESVRFVRELERAPWNARRVVLSLDRLVFPDWERKAVRSYDGVAAVSEHDRAWIARHAPGISTTVVPNGVDVDYFRPRPAGTTSPSIVFTGVMNYPPNIDAVLWFAQDILPRLRERLAELRFVVVGSKPTADVLALAGRPGIEVTGMVEDIRPYIANAIALVVPLRSGGGTRLKILQAMAMGRPVVSTTLGAEGLEVRDGEHILIADDPDRFVEQILILARSRDLAGRVGEAARALSLAKYDWQRCLLGLEDLYRAVLPAGRA